MSLKCKVTRVDRSVVALTIAASCSELNLKRSQLDHTLAVGLTKKRSRFCQTRGSLEAGADRTTKAQLKQSEAASTTLPLRVEEASSVRSRASVHLDIGNPVGGLL